MTLFEKFIEYFGGWRVAESCNVRDLPFIADIKILLDKWGGDDRRADLWIPVSEQQPEGASIVLMFCESNNEFSVDHFSLNRPMSGIPVTHWQPLVNPASIDPANKERDVQQQTPRICNAI